MVTAVRDGQYIDLGGVGVQIVPMQIKHLKQVMPIDRQYASRPWNESLFISELSIKDTRRYTVAILDEVVVGFCGVMYLIDEAHITTLAVDEKWRGKKIATHLLLDAVGDAQKLKVENMVLEVRASNKAAQNLYMKFGFAPTGVRKNYYPEVNEDAIVMWAHDISSSEYHDRLRLISESINHTHQEWKS